MKTIKRLLFFVFIAFITRANAQTIETIKIIGYDEPLWGLYTLDQNTAFVLGSQGKIFKTLSRGDVWSVMPTGFTNYSNKIFFLNQNTGFCIGENGFIIKTVDGGLTWNQFLPIPTNKDLRSIFSFGSQLYITGSFGTRLRSTDMGNSWINFSINGMNDHFYDGKFNGSTGYMVSASNTPIWKSNDGITWESGNLPSNTYALGIQINDGVIHIFGQNSSNLNPVVLRSDNNGQTWDVTPLPSGVTLNDVAFSGSTGFVVGSNYDNQIGRVYKTTNNGLNWSFFYEKTGTQLYSVTCVGNSVLVSGDLGNIYRSDIVVGVSQVSSEVLETYSLSQNYPNPFNPETKISFSIPKSGLVTLKVYDMSGREIETLVNDALSAGSYQYSFTASALTSGTYFYRLETEGFEHTRKMMLIK